MMAKYERTAKSAPEPTTAQQLEIAAHWFDEAAVMAKEFKQSRLLEFFRRVARDCRRMAGVET